MAAVLLAAGLAACGSGARGGSPAGRAAAPGPTASERQAIHAELERVTRACSAKGRGRAGGATTKDVERLLAFRRRYPAQRFALEAGGETGTMLSVLLIARAALVRCSPAGVEAIDRVLPARIRNALPRARGARGP